MKIASLTFLFCVVLFSCEPRPEINPNALTEPLTIENKEVGWKIEVPAGWELASQDSMQAYNERGLEKIEATIDLEISAPELLNLMSISKFESNIFAISAEPFFEEYIDEWKVNNAFMREILMDTYSNRGLNPEISPIEYVNFNGVDFITYSINFSKLGEIKVVKQRIYSSLFNGYDFSASMTYLKDEIMDEMDAIWKTSQFEIRDLPDSIKTHYAEMDSLYETYISDANDGFEQKKYGVAKFWYQKANEINPRDDYSRKRLVKCELFVDEVSKQEMAKLEQDWQYQKVIAKADELFNAGKYEDAHSYYLRALGINPSDQYPKEKMIEAEKIIQMDYPEWTP